MSSVAVIGDIDTVSGFRLGGVKQAEVFNTPEEAIAAFDKFLDDAIVLGYPHVRIIHGMGTGVLRKGIRKLLDKNKNVVSYRDGGPNEGGLGATLVYFEWIS